MTKSPPKKSVAQMIAYNANEGVVLRKNLYFDDFYDGENELIDSSEYRRQRGIVRVKGKIYDSRGKLVKEFETEYFANGDYKRGKSIFEDGTVQEN